MKHIYYLFISISYVLGCNKLMEDKNTNNDSTSMEWINQNSLSLISILIGILSMTLMVYYNYQQQQQQQHQNERIIQLPDEENRLNKTEVIRNIPELPHLITLKPYGVFFIQRTTPSTTLNQLIMEAHQTKRFTIVPKLYSVYNDNIVMYIELIQQTQSVVIVLDCIYDTDMDTPFFNSLCYLFTIIFNPSNTIQTWGNLMDKLKQFLPFKIYTLDELKECQSSDIQKEFKKWYNKTYLHHIECHQYLKYDNIDGLYCSCSHRPYKSNSANWSLLKAIAYTFDEYLYNNACRYYKTFGYH